MNTPKPNFPWLYLLLAYGLTWLFWIPIALTRQDYQASPILFVGMFLGAFGPSVAGIILTYREQGKEGGGAASLTFAGSASNGMLILLLFPVLHLIAVLINHWLGCSLPEFAFVNEAVAMPAGLLIAVMLYLFQSALEEFGWRGYMLDQFQALWKYFVINIFAQIRSDIHALHRYRTIGLESAYTEQFGVVEWDVQRP